MYTNFEDVDIDGRDANGNFPEGSYWDNSRVAYDDPSHQTIFYKYEFRTEEELITSSVFQRCLGQSLAHKDIEIHKLREELLKEYWRDRSGD